MTHPGAYMFGRFSISRNYFDGEQDVVAVVFQYRLDLLQVTAKQSL
jgi:hypothetical protein